MDTSLIHNLSPALTAEAMREADRFTIEELGIPGFTLMESAGRAAADCIEKRYNPIKGKRVACVCGKGNNGGDGLVVARQLAARGASIDVFLMAPPDALSEDAAHNYRILETWAGYDAESRVQMQVLDDLSLLPATKNFDIVIDALLGTGVTRTLSDPYRRVVHWINRQDARVVALDLPTGLHTDTGIVLGDAVQADLTIAMGAMKSGLIMGAGLSHAGETVVAEIGIPNHAIQRAAAKFHCPYVTTTKAVQAWLPRRKQTDHKYSVGMSLVVAGSQGLSGAAVLASQAAARSGAGAVVCAAPRQIQDILASKMTEVMTVGLPETDAGIDAAQAREALESHLPKATSLLVGCGLGRQPSTQQFIRELTAQSDLPTVIDADGLNAFIGQTELFARHAKGKWILTPHVGEFKRLAGETIDLNDRISVVREYARKWRCVFVLKGAPSLVGDPEGQVFISPLVNPALATAGSGDVLAGLCAGFLAQGLTPVTSALSALYLGGQAANRYTSLYHPATMLASDLIAHFTQVMTDYKL